MNLTNFPNEILLSIISYCPKSIPYLGLTCIKFYRLSIKDICREFWINCLDEPQRSKSIENAMILENMFDMKLTNLNNIYGEVKNVLNRVYMTHPKFHMFLDPYLNVKDLQKKLYNIFSKCSSLQLNNYRFFMLAIAKVFKKTTSFHSKCLFLIAFIEWKNRFESVPVEKHILYEIKHSSKFDSLPLDLLDCEKIYKTISTYHTINPYIYKYSYDECKKASIHEGIHSKQQPYQSISGSLCIQKF